MSHDLKVVLSYALLILNAHISESSVTSALSQLKDLSPIPYLVITILTHIYVSGNLRTFFEGKRHDVMGLER